MHRTFRYLMLAAAAAAVAACGGGDPDTSAQGRESPLAKRTQRMEARLLALAAPAGAGTSKVDSRLARARGSVQVWVSLDDTSVASYKAAELEAQGVDMQSRGLAGASVARLPDAADTALKARARSHRDTLRGKQDTLMSQLRGMGATELGRVQVAHNAVAVSVDAASLAAIAQLPGVARVRPVIHYELDLSETVPYVGGALVQASGVTGKGVRVAVLDSGIDYTHRNLGGAGTAAAYAAAYGAGPGDALQTTRDGLFPTAKVVDGFDFVGEAWPQRRPQAKTRTRSTTARPRHARRRHHRRRRPEQGHGAGRFARGGEGLQRGRHLVQRRRAAARAWISRSTRTATATPATRST